MAAAHLVGNHNHYVRINDPDRIGIPQVGYFRLCPHPSASTRDGKRFTAQNLHKRLRDHHLRYIPLTSLAQDPISFVCANPILSPI